MWRWTKTYDPSKSKEKKILFYFKPISFFILKISYNYFGWMKSLLGMCSCKTDAVEFRYSVGPLLWFTYVGKKVRKKL